MKTNDDICKALEQCAFGDGSCRGCPLEDELGCRQKVLEYALETINRLYKNLNLTGQEQYTNGRHDGVREFAERLKEAFDVRTEPSDIYISTTDLDRIVALLTEENDGTILYPAFWNC